MGFRSVEVLAGDTLQRLSLREMGDAAHWVDIALLNGLHPPYLAASASPGVAAYGDTILIPVEVVNPVAETGDPFLSDLVLKDGFLQTREGDLVLVSGVNNLLQALQSRIMSRKRSLWFHPEYGCWVHAMIGAINGQTAGGMAAFYVKSSVLEDDRVKSVERITAEVIGDTIHVSCILNPVYGESVAFNQVL